MSKTLHVQKKRIVEYDYSGWFNHGMEELHGLLDTLDVEYTTRNEWASEYDEDFEIKRSSLKKAITELKNYKDGKETKFDPEDIKESIEECGMTTDEVIECFEWMVNNSDQSHDWIYVDFY